MSMMSFADAISDSVQFSRRHLLLGNGFSIACRADIFHYGSLFTQADFSSVPEVKVVFNALDTQDFEAAIHALERAAAILPAYLPGQTCAATKMVAHAEILKEILVQTIARNHPHVPSDIPDEKFRACRRFLAHFLSGDKAGCVFTLNYDLLLYWALMHDGMSSGETLALATNDGFGNVEDEPDADYVVWQGETNAHSACVMFLHGALHLFDTGKELIKYTWVRRGVPLIDQVGKALAHDAFPLFVAEGTSTQKKAKIRHNAYLYQGFKQFTANVMQGNHCMFVFGHSLAENDDHILNRIGRGRCRRIYIGIFGDPAVASNQQIMARAEGLKNLRQEKWPLEIAFYDAASAQIWDA